MEYWKEIAGYNGDYLVSSLGRIKSFVKDRTGRLMCPYTNPKRGYAGVFLTKGGKKHYHLIHRLMAEAFIENPEGKETVNHKDGVKANNTVENLEWMTNRENVLHAMDNGLVKCREFGENHPRAVLSNLDVKRIKMCLWCAMSKAEIASIFDVCVQRIDEISRERGWAHVKLTVA